LTGSFGRERTDGERGWVLLSVLVISTLYFALIALVLWESTVRYRAAQRFRARVVAQALAESAAELAASGLARASSESIQEETDDGLLLGECTVSGNTGEGTFHIVASGQAHGVVRAEASVEVWGRLRNGRVVIDRTSHSQ
jgi:Tfp pilus assembly protein PilX